MSIGIELKPYSVQAPVWPTHGQHILAQFNESSVIVYQAYNSQIGLATARQGYFGGGGFSFERTSWIKPGFLWMMYRSGWATKPNQEVILAIRLKRPIFDQILASSVHSSFIPSIYTAFEAWRTSMRAADVILQWDPDHAPNGARLRRRALQLGLRREMLQRYSRDAILSIEDITPLVHEQRAQLGRDRGGLMTPAECVYPVQDAMVAARIGVDAWDAGAKSKMALPRGMTEPDNHRARDGEN